MAGELDLRRRSKSRRVFFALWPDEATRAAFAAATRELAEGSGGRAVPPGNLHVTLLFVGSVAEHRIPQLQSIAQRVATELSREARAAGTLTLRFERIEHWRKPHLLCATIDRGPESAGIVFAAGLAWRLREELGGAGFSLDQMGFKAHVTLARKVAGSCVREMNAVPWNFESFALVESHTGPQGSVYTVLATFPLR